MVEQSEVLGAALYARVSSDRQAEAGTIASQVEALEQRMRADGLAVEAELRFLDDGYTGATLARPELERLRDLAATGGIDRLYVLCPDRLARNYAHQFFLLEELRDCNVEVVFLNHRIGRSPEENMLLQMQGMIAEYERTKIAERCRRGRLHAARQGSVSVLGKAPLGYRYVGREQGGGAAQYQIVFEDAQLVRQIFTWVGQEGVSLREVCNRLKKQGIRTRTGGRRWHPATISGILSNPAYRGAAAFGRTRAERRTPPLRPARGSPQFPRNPNVSRRTPPDEWISIPVPPLVSDELFAAVQERLQENRKRNRLRRSGAKYLLQGLVVCKQCGYAYRGKTACGQRYRYYRCNGTEADRFDGERICRSRQVRAGQLDQAVWDDVHKLLSEPQRLEQEYQRRLAGDRQDDSSPDERSLKKRIAGMRRGIERLIDAYQDGLLDKGQFETRITTARRRLDELETQLAERQEQTSQRETLRLAMSRLEEFAQQVSSDLDDADWATRRKLIITLVKHIEIDADEVHIVYRVAAGPFDHRPERGNSSDCLQRPATPSGLGIGGEAANAAGPSGVAIYQNREACLPELPT